MQKSLKFMSYKLFNHKLIIFYCCDLDFQYNFPYRKMKIADQLTFKRRGKTVPTFLKKTYQILEDPSSMHAVKWADNGIGFIVIDQDLFSKQVLPKFFKHSNYSSFVRQLNMYNFHKIREGGKQSFFHHEMFDKNDKTMLSQIRRKPEKKRRKHESSDDQKVQQQIENKQKKIYKTPKVIKKQSVSTIHDRKHANTHEGIFSENDHLEEVQNLPPSQNIFSIEAQQDRISINDEIIQPYVPICTRQMICPSYNNIVPMHYEVVSHPSLNSLM